MNQKTETKYIFHTVWIFKWFQVFAVNMLQIGIIFIYVLYFVAPINQEESVWWARIGLTIMGLVFFGLFSFYWTWPRQLVEVEIEENILRGKNVFGTRKEVPIDTITEVFIKSGNVYFRVTNSDFFCFNPNMDFLGFLIDFLLIQRSFNSISEEIEKKYRSDPGFWSYTRENPYDAPYPEGYLDWFVPKLEQQKELLIGRGILKRNVFYGDNRDPLFNPDSLHAKVERLFEKPDKKSEHD